MTDPVDPEVDPLEAAKGTEELQQNFLSLDELKNAGDQIDQKIQASGKTLRYIKEKIANSEGDVERKEWEKEKDSLEEKIKENKQARVHIENAKIVKELKLKQSVLKSLNLSEKLAESVDLSKIEFKNWDEKVSTREEYAEQQIKLDLADKVDDIRGGAAEIYEKFKKTPEELKGAQTKLRKKIWRALKDNILGTKRKDEEGYWAGIAERWIIFSYLMTNGIVGAIIGGNGKELLSHHKSLQNIADGVQGCYEWNLTTGEVYKIGTCGYAAVSSSCCMNKTTDSSGASTLCSDDSDCYGPISTDCKRYSSDSSDACVDSANDGSWGSGGNKGIIYSGKEVIKCTNIPNSTDKKYCLQYCDNDPNNPNMTNLCKPCPPRDGLVPYSQMTVTSFDPKKPGDPDPSKPQKPYLSICKNTFPVSTCSFATQLCKPEIYSLESTSKTWISGGCYNCNDPNLPQDKKNTTDEFPYGQCATADSGDKNSTKYVQFPICVSASSVFQTIHQLAYLKPLWAPNTKVSIWSWSLLIISFICFVLVVIWYILYLVRNAANRYK
jgi:hypothetical protein